MCISRSLSRARLGVASATLFLVLTALEGSARAQYNGPFLIDGQVQTDSSINNSGVDGVTIVTQPTEPNNSTKELGPKNGSGTKVSSVHTAQAPMLEETNPTPSTDLNTIFTQTEKDANKDIWFYFAWIRDAGSGAGFVALELQQNELNLPGQQPVCDYSNIVKDSLCNPWRNRSAGDVLFLWDYSGSTSYLILRTFAANTTTGQVYLPACPQNFPTTENDYCKKVVPGTNFNMRFGGTTGSDKSRGEAAINLTQVLFPSGTTCRNFANIIPNTVTGNSDTADYKDTVLFDFDDISNCGTVTVTKQITPFHQDYAGDTFTYNLQNAGAPIFDGSGLPAECSGAGTGNSLCVGAIVHAETDQIKNVLSGTGFTLTEGAFEGYSPSIVCTFDETEYASSPQTGQLAFPFPVEADEVTECVITNTRLRGALRITKRVINDNGGTATPGDFTIARGDGGGPSPVLGSVSADGVTFSPSPDGFSEYGYDKGQTFSVSESGPGGYDQTSMTLYKYQNGQLVGSPEAGCLGTIDADVVFHCVITNNDQAPRLTLNKVVVNDSGGTTLESAWTLTANGDAAGMLSGPGTAGTADVVSTAIFKTGTYALSESGPGGYTASAWVCTGTGTQNGSSITLALGQSATCTITNDDNAASLTLNKVVVNDNGGTTLESAWTLTANGGGAGTLSGPGAVGAADVVSTAAFKAGTYALSESGPAGYAASAWVCTGTGTQSGSSITLALGQSATCTITNDDNVASLTLNKVVVNDNGGTAPESAWTLTANGGAAGTLSGPGAVGAADVVSTAAFKAGTYALSESGPGGYAASAWVCAGGTQSGSSITLALGQNATCTITNDDNAASLTLNKVVVNDNGGTTLESAWTLTANGGAAGTLSGPGAVGAADVVSTAAFKAGTYALSESGPGGYAASAWVCVGGTQSGSSITLALGQNATCTITNDDNAASLTLNKVVVNDNGGTTLESAWTLTANGGAAGTLSGPGAVGAADVVSTAAFKAGTYALSESGPGGYTASAWVCVGGTQNGSGITVGLGESATCTITNDDLLATPGGYTVQRAVLHDSFRIDAGIRVGGATPLTVTFRLYSDDQCSELEGQDEVVDLVALPNGAGEAKTAEGVLVEIGPAYYWTAEFSGNNFNQGFTTACGSEKVDLIFTDTAP